MNEQKELRPQEGPQTEFLTCDADVAFFGGGCGCGKSYATLLDNLYDVDKPGYRSVVFRRTSPMIKQPGGLLDVSQEIYPNLGAKLNLSSLEWEFPSGAVIKFAGMELPSDRFSWQGSQIALICFEELQEFESSQFWFLFSRNRSMSGAKCRIRATCNPVSDGWLRAFLDWWIGPDGYPLQERAGKWRWFIREDGDSLIWADTKAELLEKFGADCGPKSCTFIPALVGDNKILLERDPGYVANLKALPLVDRERLLRGNWDVRSAAGNFFRREWFRVANAAPAEVVGRVRFWDRAGSEQKPGSDPDATCSVLLSKTANGTYFVEHVLKMFATPFKVQEAMVALAKQDGRATTIAFAQDPASAGLFEAQSAARALDGWPVKFAPATGSKEVRARPCSSAAEAGRIEVLTGPWLDDFLRELEGFPDAKHDDVVDALTGAYEILAGGSSDGCFTASHFQGGFFYSVTRPSVVTPRSWQMTRSRPWGSL